MGSRWTEQRQHKEKHVGLMVEMQNTAAGNVGSLDFQKDRDLDYFNHLNPGKVLLKIAARQALRRVKKRLLEIADLQAHKRRVVMRCE